LPNADEVSAPQRVGLYRGLKRALDRPGADFAVVVIALVLLAFSLDTGLSADDYIHELIATGSHAIRGFVRAPLDMYRFTDSPRTTLTLMHEGVLEWWADPEAKLAFFRPLSSLTHYLDYVLWPTQPWLMHLHSLLWTALLFAGVLVLNRELLSTPWVCALATFLYALDDGRGWAVSWIAARNAVVATAISVWALVMHHRARAKGFRAGVWLSPLLLLLSLLGGEGAIAICGYLLGYALLLEHGPLGPRLRSLLPHAAVVVAWRVVYVLLGYGVAHSGLYFDPVGDTADYLRAFVERAPILLFAQVGGSWSDAWSTIIAFPLAQRAMVLIATACLAGLGYALWPLLRRDATVRFGVFGALLSVVPASATFAADRLLTWIAIGASIALARLIATYIDERDTLTTTALRALVLPPMMLGMVFSKAVIDPLFLPSRARGNLLVRDNIDRAQAAVPRSASIRDKRVVYVNPIGVPLAAYIAIERAATGVPRPAGQLLLATSETEVRVERADARTLRVQQRGGFLLSPGSRLLRNPARTFRVGAVIRLDGVEVTVTKLCADGRPAEMLARFDRPLEDPSLFWLRWGASGYVPFTPPKLGAHVVLPAADFVRAVFGDTVRLPIDGRMPPPPDPLWPE
jgi:hypothetical protein